MKSKINKQRAIALILAFVCLGLTELSAQGESCTVQISGGNFSGPTFVGNDNVTVMYVPKEDLLAVAKELEQLEKEKQEVLAKAKAADQLIKQAEERIKVAEEKERAAELAKEASRKEKEKSIRALKQIKKANQNFDSNKQKFMSEVQQVVEEFEAGVSRRELEGSKELNSTPSAAILKVNAQIKEVEEKGKAIIRGLSCMANDHEVYEIKEENGTISFGFNVEDLKNDPNYTIVGELQEGRRVVKKFNVFGYMDQSGQPVINYQYDFADRFYNGKAIVKKHKEWFFIDRNGKVLQSFGTVKNLRHLNGETYELAKSYGNHFLMDGEGKILSPAFDEIRTFFGEDLFRANTHFDSCGLINRSGEFVLAPEYRYIRAIDKYGFAAVQRKTSNKPGAGTKYGLVNTKGKLILQPKFEFPLKLNGKNGYTIYEEGYGGTGIIHHEKGIILTPRKRDISKIKGNTFQLKTEFYFPEKSYRYGIFDVDRGMLLEEEYLAIKFSEKNNYCWAKSYSDFAWNLYDSNFQKVGGKKQSFEDYRDFDVQGKAYVKINGLWGTINEQGKYLLKPNYQELFQSAPKGVYRFKKNDKWGLLDAKGNTLHKGIYDNISTFDSNGFSAIELSDKFGVMKRDGKFIIPVAFETLQWLSDFQLIFAGSKEGAYQVFDFTGQEKGRIALPTCRDKRIAMKGILSKNEEENKYHHIEACGLSNLINKETFALQIGEFYKEKQKILDSHYLIKNAKDKWVLYDDKGQVVFGPFGEVVYLGDQYFKVRTKKWTNTGKESDAGIIDLAGNLVVEEKYHKIIEYRDQLAIVQKGRLRFEIGVVNLFGAEIIPPIFKAIKFTDLNQIEVTALNTVSNSQYIDETFIIDDKGNCLTNCENYNKLLRAYYKK